MSETLKPCPFCGGEAEVIEAYGWLVQCTSCFASVGQNCTEGGFLAGDYQTEAEAIAAWNTRTPDQAIAATLGDKKAKAHPYGYEPDTGAFDTTRCECGCLNDISATYCNDCGGEIEIDEDGDKEIYKGRRSVFATKHDDGSLEFGGKRDVVATLGDNSDAVAFCKRIEGAVANREPLTLFGVDYYATLGGVGSEVGSEVTSEVRGGKLTAEQVREAIERNVTFYEGGDYDAQAIADELNATLGGGECTPHGEWKSISQTQEVRHVFCECGFELGMDRRDSFPFECTKLFAMPNFCSECGRKIRKAVKR